ncbi:MAG: hypothetical protein ACYCXT_01110 [Acidiferrobacteraceae bacterium]
MTRPANRSELMERLGATQTNTVWSWCAVNEHERKVYFSVWSDFMSKRNGQASYTIQEPNWGINETTGKSSAARSDQDEKLRLVFEHGYEAYAYFIEAKDPVADPREIAHTRTSFVMRMRLIRLEDGSVIGTPLDRIDVA